MRHFLVVVDMQKDFIDGALGTAQAQAITANAVKKIQRFDGTVFATLDTHFENYLDSSEGRKLPVPHCIKGTDGWMLNPEIKQALNEKGYIPVEKPTFGSAALPGLLKEAAGEEDFDITLIGLCTDICVVSNALLLKAHFPEKEIAVDPSCCAGVTPETHEAAIATMKCCQITIL